MNNPPVAFAVMGNDLELVKKRLSSGCDINEITDKGTALHVACIYNRLEIGRFLLENGANPRAKNQFGQMPIDIADNKQMVELLREFGVTEYGVYHFNQLKRDGQRNAFLLGNTNSVEHISNLLDAVDHYYGFNAPWISLDHVNVLENVLNIQTTNVDSPIATATEGQPKLYSLDSQLLKGVELDDKSLFDLGAELCKTRPFKKLRQWEKYNVFFFLSQLRGLNFVAKKKKLLPYFQQWHESGR